MRWGYIKGPNLRTEIEVRAEAVFIFATKKETPIHSWGGDICFFIAPMETSFRYSEVIPITVTHYYITGRSNLSWRYGITLRSRRIKKMRE